MTPDIKTFLITPAILVDITAVKGSTPRATDAFILVSATDIWGTIGGGQLEFLAINHARRLLAGADGESSLDIPLGPEIGQCCGGRVEIGFSRAEGAVLDNLKAKLQAERDARPEVWLFGAGHVGKALAEALALLPVKTTVVETRESELDGLPADVTAKLAAMPESLVGDIAPESAVLILTHDHALDFLIAGEALRRDDLAYVGMIGSKTKRATFAGWARREGLGEDRIAALTLPIGGRAVYDKRPAVIAAMTIAEILTRLADSGSLGGRIGTARDGTDRKGSALDVPG